MATRINERHAGTIERARAAFREERARSFGFNITTPRYQVGSPQWQSANAEAFAKAFRSQAAVYACVLKRANGVSQAPLRVYKESDGDPDEQPDHGLRKLMANPNPVTSEAEFHVHTITQMDAVGFAAIEIERAVAGNILGLWHLRADWLRMIPQDQAPPTWEYRVPGRDPRIIPAEEIIVIPGGPSTDLKPVGMPPIEVALREIGINDSATDFLKLFLDTGGVPRHALISPNEIKDQAKADALKERWSQTYGGYRNWTQVALLHGGLDVKEIGANLDGLAYPQLRALLETHICAVYGVPPILVGMQAGLDAATYSNYAQARRAFFEDTIASLWSRIAGAIGRSLLPAFGNEAGDGVYVAFDTSNVVALQEDATQRWARAKEAATAGLITLNQFQSLVGLPGFGKDGDVLLLPFSVAPTRPDDLSKLADQTAEPPEPPVDPNKAPAEDDDDEEPADDEPSGDADDEATRNAETRRNAEAEREVRTMLLGGNVRDGGTRHYVQSIAARHGLRELPIEMRERIVSGNRRQVTRLATQQWAILATLFRSQGERVAKAYGKRSAEAFERRDIADLDALFGELDEEMRASLTAFYQRAGETAYRTASRVIGVGIDFDLSNPYVRRTQRDLARRIVGINETTRSDVRNVITDGIEAGKTHTAIADDLRGLYSENYRNRSLTIARTESQVAYNLSNADAYKASGRVLAMIVHDNPLHDSDPGSDGLTCAQRNGVITDVDAVQRHIYAEHPNGTMATSPLLVRPLGSP